MVRHCEAEQRVTLYRFLKICKFSCHHFSTFQSPTSNVLVNLCIVWVKICCTSAILQRALKTDSYVWLLGAFPQLVLLSLALLLTILFLVRLTMSLGETSMFSLNRQFLFYLIPYLIQMDCGFKKFIFRKQLNQIRTSNFLSNKKRNDSNLSRS